MNIKSSKFISYIILCITVAVLFYLNNSLLSQTVESLKSVYPYLQSIIIVYLLCIIFSPFWGIGMYLYKSVRIYMSILLFLLLSGFCVFFAFPAGMVMGTEAAIFIFTLLTSVLSGAHFVYVKLLTPSKTALRLAQRGTNKKRITRLTSVKASFSALLDSADFLLCVIIFSSAASSYILNFQQNIFNLASLILLLCFWAVVSLVSLIISWLLYR